MVLTPETIARHELNGLYARVVEANNADLVGIEGRVVTETTKTLRVADDSRVRQVPKSETTFEFEIPPADDAAATRKGAETAEDLFEGDSAAYVTVDGDRLLSRPARRTETTGDSKWR